MCRVCIKFVCSLFRLQVPVHDVMPVAVLYRANHLLKEPAGFIFWHLRISAYPHPSISVSGSARLSVRGGCTYTAFALLDNVIEQLLPCILHHHDHVRRRRNDLIPFTYQLRPNDISQWRRTV
jgi:hypothetical protein